ncbi:MAG: 3-deoxy-manno-octulosonate cytidylyltransferase [Flavobacteriales bacterium]
MRVVALIPARYGATRFPGKLMADLGGKSVILRTYESTQKTGLFDAVFVVTDHPTICDEIVKNGGKAVMRTRQYKTGSDRIAAAVESIDADVVVNVQGDEPFTQRKPLEDLLALFHGRGAQPIDVATLMQEISDWKAICDPNFVKVVADRDGYALYFSRAPIPHPRDRETSVRYFEHIGIYAFRKQALLDFSRLPIRTAEATEQIEALRFLEYGMKVKLVETEYMGIEIDTPADLSRAQRHITG